MTMHSPIKSEAAGYSSAEKGVRSPRARGRQASGWLVIANIAAIAAVLAVGLYDLFAAIGNRTTAHTVIGSTLVIAALIATFELYFSVLKRRFNRR